jgi:hypothetical protein
MNEQQYRKHKNSGSSIISRFAKNGRLAKIQDSPKAESKSERDAGLYLEAVTEFLLTGDSGPRDQFYIADLDEKIPPALFGALKSDQPDPENELRIPDNAKPGGYRVVKRYNKDGTENKRNKPLFNYYHMFLDNELIGSEIRVITDESRVACEQVAADLVETEIGALQGLTLAEAAGIADDVRFQVPYIADIDIDGIEVGLKALVDLDMDLPAWNTSAKIIFDLKFYRNMDAFERYMRYEFGWVQGVQYPITVEHATGQKLAHPRMIYLCGFKKPIGVADGVPQYQSKIFELDPEFQGEYEFRRIARQFQEWKDEEFPIDRKMGFGYLRPYVK